MMFRQKKVKTIIERGKQVMNKIIIFPIIKLIYIPVGM